VTYLGVDLLQSQAIAVNRSHRRIYILSQKLFKYWLYRILFWAEVVGEFLGFRMDTVEVLVLVGCSASSPCVCCWSTFQERVVESAPWTRRRDSVSKRWAADVLWQREISQQNDLKSLQTVIISVVCLVWVSFLSANRIKVLMIIRYYECVFSCLRCPPCKSYLLCAALYCLLCPVWLWHFFFPNYLIHGSVFEKQS